VKHILDTKGVTHAELCDVNRLYWVIEAYESLSGKEYDIGERPDWTLGAHLKVVEMMHLDVWMDGGRSKKYISGYTLDWAAVSTSLKKAHKWTCSHCGLRLFGKEKKFIHAHHINGNKQDNSSDNLEVLCAMCHGNKPGGGHKAILTKLRKSGDMEMLMEMHRVQRTGKAVLEPTPYKLPKEKKCTKCNESKLLINFHKKTSSIDGRVSQCKECRKCQQQ